MAEIEEPHGVAELRGQVRSLGEGLARVSSQVEVGLKDLTDFIRTSNEKTEQRIEATNLRTDARFEALNQSAQRSSAEKGSNNWQLITLAAGAIFSIASLGVTIFTLVKTPIDDAFKRLEHTIEIVEAQQKALTDNLPIIYVPRNENKRDIEELHKQVDDNTKRVNALEIAAADSSRDRSSLHDTVDNMNDAIKTYATLPQYQQLDSRVTVISQRLQTLFDKNYAIPAVPCVGPGCGNFQSDRVTPNR